MSSLLCDECKKPVCDWKHAETAIPLCDTCLFRDDSKGQPIADSTLVQEESASPLQRSVQEETASPLQGSVQEERTQSSNVIVTSKNNENGTKYNPKSPDNMVINKCLPPRETEDTHFQDLSLKPTRLNGLPETPIPAVVGNLGINLREDVSYQSVSLPLDKEAPSFIPKTDWKKTQKLFKQPKDEFQSGSVTYGTEKALQELLERGVQLTTGTHGVLLKKDMDPVCGQYKKDCHYIHKHYLGAGSFGSVYLCKDTDSEKEFVKKEIKKDLFKDSEVVVPLSLKHINMTEVFGLIQEEDEDGSIKMCLLMEYGGISLNVFMARHCDLQECHFFQLAKHGLRGLEYMHKFGMNHFDIKPENLLVMYTNNSLLMKLSDFGTSKLAQERISWSGLTPEYMAPECARFVLQCKLINRGLTWNAKESDVTEKADVFPMALSILYMYYKVHVLVKLITRGETTYNHMGVKERHIKQTELLIMLATDQTFVQRLIPDKCNPEMRSLLKMMTEHDPKQRCSAQEARRFIEEYQQKKEQKLCSKSVQATDHALKLKAKQQAVTKEKQVFTEKMVMQNSVSETATTILQPATGPIKNSTRQKLRNKLMPYSKPPALAVQMTPVEELNKQRIQSSFEREHHILAISDQQPLTEDQEREMQPAIPTPSLFGGGEMDFSVYNSWEGLIDSNHQILRLEPDDSSRSRAFDENEVPENLPNFALL